MSKSIRTIRKHDVKIRRHCPLCGAGANLQIDFSGIEMDLSYAKLLLRCPNSHCSYKDIVQIFLNVDFCPLNERVEFRHAVVSVL